MIKTLQKKLNAWGRHLLDKGDLSGEVEVLVRTEKPLSHPQHKEMRAVGYRSRSIVGNVLSGIIDVKDLEKIAEFDFVRKIEFSTPMFQEGQN
jgi:hypothetical protein